MSVSSGRLPVGARVRPGALARSTARAVPLAQDSHDPAVLLAETGRGDREAFARLYDLLAPRVFGTGRALHGDRAEEATATAFLELWRRAPRWPGGSPATALEWALRVAVEALAAGPPAAS